MCRRTGAGPERAPRRVPSPKGVRPLCGGAWGTGTQVPGPRYAAGRGGGSPGARLPVPARAMKVAGGEWAPLGGAVRVRRFLGVGRPSPPSSFPVLFMEAQPASLLLPSWSDQ